MVWWLPLLQAKIAVFALVLSRVGGLAATAPIFGSNDVPAQVRGLLAVSIALLLMPVAGSASVPAGQSTLSFLVLIGSEALIGLALGFGINVLFSGIQIAGQVIGQMSGMQLAEVFNPSLDASVPVFSQLLYYVTLAVFVLLGGHRKVMAALLETFSTLPLGGRPLGNSIVETMTALITTSFELGVRAAAPAMVALMLATLILGLISRTLPQLNVMAMGFGFNAMITLAALFASLGGVAWVFQEHVDPVLESLVAALHT